MNAPASDPCDLPDDPSELLELAEERCLRASAPLEFSTFKLGVKGPKSWLELPEAEVRAWKKEFKRTLGGRLEALWEDREVDFRRPDLRLIFDIQRGRVQRKVTPLYLYGRYRKLSRDLPQTDARWKHEPCAGKGCEGCADTGRRYPVSLADLIGAPALERAEARDYALHGAGREDVDVRCLGEGRPFVLELSEPRRRTLDLEALAAEVAAGSEGRVEVEGLVRTRKETIGRIKEAGCDKRYRARCRVEGSLDSRRVGELSDALSGAELAQDTPGRVSHRRASVTRSRQVRELAVVEQGPGELVLEIEAESGTYIKELISGDEGRTRPSVSGLLGVPTRCVELDVLAIRFSDVEALTKAPKA